MTQFRVGGFGASGLKAGRLQLPLLETAGTLFIKDVFLRCTPRNLSLCSAVWGHAQMRATPSPKLVDTHLM